MRVLPVIFIVTLTHVACGQNKSSEEHARWPTAETRTNVSLFIAETLPDSNVGNPQILTRYLFQKGQRVAREEILTTPISEVRYDLAKNRTYLNNFAVTHWGDVIDIRNKRVLHEGIGEQVVAFEGNRVILQRGHVSGTGLYAFDFAEKEHTKLEQPGKWSLARPNWRTEALLSPNGTNSIYSECDRIILLSQNSRNELARGLTCQLSPRSSELPWGGAPMLWLDNQTILTQRSNGELITVDLQGNMTPLVTIPCTDLPVLLPSLSRDLEGRIIYRCGSAYVIDVEKRSSARRKWYKLGHGFDVEDTDTLSASIIRYRGQIIGEFHITFYSAKTTEGHLAVTYRPEGQIHARASGVKVWSSINREWTSIDPYWAIGMIGWVEDETTSGACGPNSRIDVH